MRRHSTFRSGNPTLTSKVFENLERPKSGPLVRDDVMTIQGTVDKTGISLALLIFAGYFAYVPDGFLFMIAGGLGGFIVAIITVFKKTDMFCAVLKYESHTKKALNLLFAIRV